MELKGVSAEFAKGQKNETRFLWSSLISFGPVTSSTCVQNQLSMRMMVIVMIVSRSLMIVRVRVWG